MKTLKKNRTIIILSTVLALVLFGGILAIQSYLSNKYEIADTLALKQDLPAGTEITKENAKEYFEQKQVLASTLNNSIIRDEKEVYGTYTSNELAKGTLVYKNFLRRDETEISHLADPVEISVSLNNIANGVSGTLRKGDYVYIYFTDPEEGTVNMYGKEPVYIKQSFSSSGEPIAISDCQTAASVFTLVIDRSESSGFCELAQHQDITLVRTENLP